MKKKIIIKTSGTTSQTFICTLCQEDQDKIRKEIHTYIKEHISWDINLDNDVSVSVENAMNGRLTDLEETFEFVYGGGA